MSEAVIHKPSLPSDTIERAKYLNSGFRDDFLTFSLGDRIFSGIEQIVCILLSILGLCALEDVITCEKVDE